MCPNHLGIASLTLLYSLVMKINTFHLSSPSFLDFYALLYKYTTLYPAEEVQFYWNL